MKKIVLDCDNTMGLLGKDVDDGLVLIYLLACTNIELLGISSVFGNGTQKEAYKVTKKMLKELNKDIPLYAGSDDSECIDTPAANFLVEIARKNPGELVILAIGPLSNLKGAYQIDDKFFTYLKEIVIMGGLTKPLIFRDKEVSELNLSCDPIAAELVLKAAVPITLMTGNICLQAFFNNQDWQRLQESNIDSYQYIRKRIKGWYILGEKIIGNQGFYMWDLVSALYITHPQLFNFNLLNLKSIKKDLEKGRLILRKNHKNANIKNPGLINIPDKINDIEKFKDIIFTSWANL